MSEQIREQVSAFLDGELPNSETELLLKRLTRDSELRESFGRYALIGEALRGSSHGYLTKGFADRVNGAITGEPNSAGSPAARARAPRWWRPLAGAAVAAGVAAMAVVALQQRAVAPGVVASAPRGGFAVSAVNVAAPGVGTPGMGIPGIAAQNTAAQGGLGPNLAASGVAAPGGVLQMAAAPARREPISYTVPATSAEAPAMMPAARLTNYVFAHSKYSSGLDQRGVMADMLIESEDPPPAGPAAQAPARDAP